MNVPTDHILEVAQHLEKTAADCRVRLSYLRSLVRSLNDDWQGPAGVTFVSECQGCFHAVEATFALPEVLAHHLTSLAQRFAAVGTQA